MQHLTGQDEIHVTEHTKGHDEVPLQHLTGQKDMHFMRHTSGHWDLVVTVDTVVETFGLFADVMNPGQHFTGQSGPQFLAQEEGQADDLASGSMIIVTGLGFSAPLQHLGEHVGRQD